MRTLVVGSTSGIGLALSELLTREGTEVIGVGRRSMPQDSRIWKYFQCNVAQMNCLSVIAEQIDPNTISNLVYCVGVNTIMPVTNIDNASVRNIFDINFFPFVDICKSFISMRKSLNETSIVGVGSIWSSHGIPGRSIYGATKGAMSSFVKHFSAEVKQRGCLVNIVSPGFTDTGLTAKSISDPLIMNALKRQSSDGLMQPEGVAVHISQLLVPQNRYITGQEIFVDFGFSRHV